jgi:zinc and cadmium transporter
MTTWLYSLISVFLVSIVSLIGVLFLSFNEARLNRMLLFLVSFAVGGLFGDAFIHLLPEAFEKLKPGLVPSLFIVTGILIFFILEKFVRWRHCHIPTSEHHPHPVVTMNLVGDGVHNLIDGMLIGATYNVNIRLGVATTIAVLLHEIPQEIGDFGVLIHGGLTVKKALLYNFLTALTAFAGVIITLVIGPHLHYFSIILVPITAGGFIYIAGSDLIPELQTCEPASTSIWQFCSMIAGIGVMTLLVLLD